MNELVRAIVTGITAFAATNIDDIVILTLLFAQVNSVFRPRHIVLGQYLGFVVLILASLPGFLGGLVVPPAWIGLLGFVPIAIGITHLVRRDADQPHVQTVTQRQSKKANLFAPQIYSVAAITLANGGDNIGIYVPLFANSNLETLGTILITFFVMIAVWCYIAYRLTQQPAIAHILTRYGHRAVPFVLIGLGVFILIESGTYELLPLFQKSIA